LNVQLKLIKPQHFEMAGRGAQGGTKSSCFWIIQPIYCGRRAGLLLRY
jgi:hypothetical protein